MLALAAILLPVLLYLPTLFYSFVFDDRPLLIDNPVVQAPRGLGELFTTDLDPRARLLEAPTTNYLRPLFLGLAAGIYQVAGERPLIWHLIAVLLHGGLGGLAFVLLRREGFGPWAALVASLIFTSHPAHVQSAAWVSGIQDLLFAVLALLAYLAYRSSVATARPGAGRLALLGSLYGLALLAKEPAVGLLLLAAAECWLARQWVTPDSQVPRRRGWAELALLLVVTGGYFAYRIAVLGSLAHSFPTAPPWGTALASVPLVLLIYLRDLLLPIDLFLLNPARPVTSWWAPTALAAAAGLVTAAALALWALRQRPALQRPLLWFLAWLAPSLALWAIHPEWLVMDRYLLLPSLALPWALTLAWPAAGERPLGRLGAGLLLVTFAALSWRGMRDFRDEDTFWNVAIVADPGSATAWAEWAKRRSEAGDLAAAREALEKAIALDPQAQVPRLRRALLALREAKPREAIAELEHLIARNPAYLPAWRNLVVAQDRAGDLAGASRTLAEALRRFPNDPQLWTHQAVLLRGAGRPDQALAALREAIALAPRDPLLALREALLLRELGRGEDSRAAARRGLELGPAPAVAAQLSALL